MRRRVVVTGMGCISPLGKDVDSTWENIVAGKSGMDFIRHFDAIDFRTRFAAEVKDFNGADYFGNREARRMDRYSQFAVVAASQALEDSGLKIQDSNRDRIGVIIGTGIGGMGTLYDQMQVFTKRGPMRVSPFLVPMMLLDTGGGMIAIQLKVRGPNMAVVTACASGTDAIGEATEVIRRGQADVMFAGGSEAPIVPISMAGLGVMNALSTNNDDPQGASRPFDLKRDGFVMGEGSAVLVLEALEHALAREAVILAEVSGYGSTNDAHHISAPAENGSGAVRCMQMALKDASLEVEDLDYINAHGTSTLLNDKSETAAIKTVFGEHAYQIPVSSTKSMTGHLLGATGALEAVVCVQALNTSLLPPTINYEHPDPECDLDYVPNTPRHADIRHVMSNSFGFGGHNSTIILGKFSAQRLQMKSVEERQP